MKRFLRLVSLILVMAMVASVPVYAAEQEEATPYSSAFFTKYSTYLYKISSIQFEVWFEVSATGGMTQLGVSQIKVQRSADKSTWETMKTYTPDSYSQMLCSNTGTHASCVTYAGTPGYYYRAYVTFYAKNSSGTGELFKYTAVMQL